MQSICAVLALLCIVSVAESRRSCCVPNQWEAFVSGENASVTHGRPQVVAFVEPRVSADFLANKMSIQELLYSGTVQQNLTVIVDYNVLSMWVIEWFSGHAHCVKYPLPAGSKPAKCIPANWMYTTTLRMGYGSNSILADNFVTPPGLPYFGSVLVTSDTCVPVTEYIRAGEGENVSVQSFGVFNVTLGIKDPSVFKVPAFCSSNSLEWDPDNMLDQALPQLSAATNHILKRFTTLA